MKTRVAVYKEGLSTGCLRGENLLGGKGGGRGKKESLTVNWHLREGKVPSFQWYNYIGACKVACWRGVRCW